MFKSIGRLSEGFRRFRAKRVPIPEDPAELGTHLSEHFFSQLLPAWFPRSLDHENGGFHQTFSRNWIQGAKSPRTLVFQARMTWVSATLVRRFPEMDAVFRPYTRHGLAYLGDHLWDHGLGGFCWDETGKGEKHAYGMAFGILAAAGVYRSIGAPDALALARDAFEWLDRNAHDEEFGGYFEALAPDGSPIVAGARDLTGTPYGRKTANSHLHLLEAFKELYHIWPDPHLGSRLEELVRLFQTRLIHDPGFLPPTFARDWQTKDTVASYGHDLEVVVWLMEAMEMVGAANQGPAGGGRTEDPLSPVRHVIDHAITHGYDSKNGGFFLEGHAGRPAHAREKVWWVQAEALTTLSYLFARDGREASKYLDAFRQTWSFILRYLADDRKGGWFGVVAETGKQMVDDRKGHEWKGCYHELRTLASAPAALRGPTPPLAADPTPS